MHTSLSTSKSALLVSTIFGIPSGPGALYSFSLLSYLRTCSFVTLPAPLHAQGYFVFSKSLFVWGFGGKNPVAKAAPFSPLVVAIFPMSPTLYFSAGILALPPSVAGVEMRQCTVQMTGSSAFSIQSRQCCCLVFFSVLLYLFAASVCSACTLCSRSFLRLYESLPNLLVSLRSCVNSFVHQRFDLRVISVIGTCVSMVS